MENKQKYIDTIEDLVQMADEIVKNSAPNVVPMAQDHVDKSSFLSGSKQFIVGLFGENSPMYNELNQATYLFHYNKEERYLGIKGVLLAAKKRIEQGWLSNIRNELFTEIFTDYIEMAEFLNAKGLHVAAAVIAGTTLEERVRLLAKKYLGTDKKDNGEPQSVENLNNILKDHYENKISDLKTVATYYTVRTKAAHGEWNGDSAEQKQNRIGLVDVMIKAIVEFSNRNPI